MRGHSPPSCNTESAATGAPCLYVRIPCQTIAPTSDNLQDWAAAHSIQWNLSPAESHWRAGKVEATTDLVKKPACAIPDRASAARNEMFAHSGASPHAIILGRALRSLDSSLEGGLVQMEQEDDLEFSGRAQDA